MAFNDITVERVQDWLEITLQRPEKLNTLREQTAQEVLTALALAEDDRKVHLVLLRGDARAFCAGIDTSEFELSAGNAFDFFRKRKRSRKVNALLRDLPAFTKPVISVVEGFALGGGLELALAGDLVVAGRNARLGLPEVRLGMMPGGGGTQAVARLAGIAVAKELAWTGRRIDAQQALAYRLVNHVTEAGAALDKAREIAAEIAANAPLSIMLSKSVIQRGVDMSAADGLACESDASFLLYFSQDRAEGLDAFQTRRTPSFKGE